MSTDADKFLDPSSDLGPQVPAAVELVELHCIAGAHEFPDHAQFFLARDGVRLGKLVPLDVQACRVQAFNLPLGSGERTNGIKCSVGHQETLFARQWR